MVNLQFNLNLTAVLITACVCAAVCLVIKAGCDYDVALHKNYVDAGYVESSVPSTYKTIRTKAEVKK